MEEDEVEDVHKGLVYRLAKSGKLIAESLTPAQAYAWHMATGISGEAGELLDAVKKYAVYQGTLDIENVIEELGDMEFYLQGLRSNLGITREQTLKHNYDKLSKRYSEGKYSDRQAQERADKC